MACASPALQHGRLYHLHDVHHPFGSGAPAPLPPLSLPLPLSNGWFGMEAPGACRISAALVLAGDALVASARAADGRPGGPSSAARPSAPSVELAPSGFS
eukprot:5671853-Pyramimonas_sp.AAC.1